MFNKTELAMGSKFCRKLLVMGLTGLYSGALFAGAGEAIMQVGWFSASQENSQHVNIRGLIGNQFEARKSTDYNVVAGFGYYVNGYEGDRARYLFGVNAFYMAPLRTKGKVFQEDRYANLSFHYSRSNWPIYASLKALFPCGNHFDLTAEVGVGPNIVRTRHFKEKSIDKGITEPDIMFKGKTIGTLSATAALGWRVNNIYDNLSLEISYRFFYLGQGELKKTNNQVRNNLRTGNTYANAVFVSFAI